jgi:hypothetical protein
MLELVKPIETSKFFKGNPHPHDESLPSFAAINVTEMAPFILPFLFPHHG